jgi:signal transduction histidine kinase
MQPAGEHFARLVSLACHDIRTPLATVQGFARTLERAGELSSTQSRYTQMIVAAAGEIADLVDDLGLVARIQSGRYQPTLRPVDTLRLAEGASDRLESSDFVVAGDGGRVTADAAPAERALAALAECARRHGGVDSVRLHADGPEVRIAPVTPEAAPVILGDELRDLGAATARIMVEALGGSLALDGDTLIVRFAA